MYQFDRIISRAGTSSMKYDAARPENAPEDLLSMWIADMDFETLPEVKQALQRRVENGIFGYTCMPDTYRKAVAGWMLRRHSWEIAPESIVVTPGVVPTIKNVLDMLTRKGDAVLIQPPVYYPFSTAIRLTERREVRNDLIYSGGRYQIDFEDFERKIVNDHVKLFILCNPHNPVGRVWSREELRRMGEICRAHQVLVLADEIHHDFIFPGETHTPFVCAGEGFEDFTITCTAPSKTFNLAGLKTSNIIVSNQALREAFRKGITRAGLGGLNCFGVFATEAAYTYGDRWVDELVAYIHQNFVFLDQALRERVPAVKLVPQEGLYMAWLDCSGLGKQGDELFQFFVQAGIWPDKGEDFGGNGTGFTRLNLACPRSIVAQAVDRLQRAAEQL